MVERCPYKAEVVGSRPAGPTPHKQGSGVRARRRRQLVGEKGRVLNRLQSDLQAVCPGLLSITGEADNLWFLKLLSCRDDIRKVAHPVLRHRIVTNFNAEADAVSSDTLVEKLLKEVAEVETPDLDAIGARRVLAR